MRLGEMGVSAFSNKDRADETVISLNKVRCMAVMKELNPVNDEHDGEIVHMVVCAYSAWVQKAKKDGLGLHEIVEQVVLSKVWGFFDKEAWAFRFAMNIRNAHTESAVFPCGIYGYVVLILDKEEEI